MSHILYSCIRIFYIDRLLWLSLPVPAIMTRVPDHPHPRAAPHPHHSGHTEYPTMSLKATIGISMLQMPIKQLALAGWTFRKTFKTTAITVKTDQCILHLRCQGVLWDLRIVGGHTVGSGHLHLESMVLVLESMVLGPKLLMETIPMQRIPLLLLLFLSPKKNALSRHLNLIMYLRWWTPRHQVVDWLILCTYLFNCIFLCFVSFSDALSSLFGLLMCSFLWVNYYVWFLDVFMSFLMNEFSCLFCFRIFSVSVGLKR